MARRSSYDVPELESALGPRGGVRVDSGNRALVQNWLVAHGLPAAWVKSRKISFLNYVYNSPAGLVALIDQHRQGKLTVTHEHIEHVDPPAPTEEPSVALSFFPAPPGTGATPLDRLLSASADPWNV